MFLFMKPRITILNERKIHVVRKPGITAWLLLILFTIICVGISQRLTKNSLYLIALVLGEVMFGLDTLGEWQDLLLDKHENKAIVKKYTWSDNLFLRMSDNLCTSIKLSDIRHVGVSIEMGLFILHRNGKVISLSMQGFTREELQKLRRDIDCFLDTNGLGALDTQTILSHKPHSITLDSVKKDIGDVMKISNKMPLNYKSHAVYNNLSLPNLGIDRETKKHWRYNLKKGPYTEKSGNYNNIKYI